MVAALIDVVLGRMFLGMVVGPVDYSSFPDEVELLLGLPAFQEVESHVV